MHHHVLMEGPNHRRLPHCATADFLAGNSHPLERASDSAILPAPSTLRVQMQVHTNAQIQAWSKDFPLSDLKHLSFTLSLSMT